MRWTILAAVLVSIAAFAAGLAQNGQNVLDLRLGDTDDTMRLLQVFRWLDGAAWTDLAEPRLNPPQGLVMHWARLPDLPLAAVIAAVEPLAGRHNAAVAAIMVVPTALLALLLLVSAWACRPLAGRASSLVAVVAPVLMVLPLAQFRPGRIDHHGWQMILAMGLVGLMVRLLLRRARGLAVAAGIVPALGLWVGIEILPWLAVFNLSLGLKWVIDGERDGLDQGLVASATLAALGLGMIP
ncbi:MAG TPA: hypothetical protein VEB64_16545, partial [Azospirillaceae bacterium]|nr:hypothetical protein [Azospirillaceae bacterium]